MYKIMIKLLCCKFSNGNISFITTNMKKILCVLTVNPQFLQFAIPQLKALLHDSPIPLTTLFQQQLQGKDCKHHYEINYKQFDCFPFIVLTVPQYEKHQEYFKSLCKEAVMIFKTILLISSGNSYEQLIANADQQFLKQTCRNEDEQLLCDFYSHNRIFQREDQISRIHKVLGSMDVKGKINFKTPNLRYQLMQSHTWYQNHHKEDSQNTLKKVFFGLQLCSNKIATAKFNFKYQLNKRIYLGPTSTDNDLAFMMCNQGLVKAGSMVIDPFVGTGGLLIPPSTKKAIVFGSDLDIRVINGYSVGRINKRSPYYNAEAKFQLFTPKINLNFQQYDLDMPNIIRIDSTSLNFRQGEIFDAVITDPPYGIRAMSRSLTKKEEVQKSEDQEVDEIQKNEVTLEKVQSDKDEQEHQNTEEINKNQLSQQEKLRKKQKRRILRQNKKKRKQNLTEQQKKYKQNLVKKLNRQRIQQWDKFDKGKIQTTQREKIFAGLLTFGRKYLKQGGRLVFLYPIYQEEQYLGVKNLPTHEGFRVLDLSENKMSRGNSRILVTMEKI